MRTHTVHSARDNTQMLEQIRMIDMYNSIVLCTPILFKLYLLTVNIITCFGALDCFLMSNYIMAAWFIRDKETKLFFINFFFCLIIPRETTDGS